MEAEKGSTPCWEWCEVYGQFKEGERVKEKELCPNCPVRDFQAVLKRLTADVLYDEAPCKDKESPVHDRCALCDFWALTRFEEPCYSCNEAMRRRMLAQNQIRAVT